MEDANIFLKFKLQTQAKYIPKYKSVYKAFYHEVCWNIYSAKVSYCQNSDIREVIIALVW